MTHDAQADLNEQPCKRCGEPGGILGDYGVSLLSGFPLVDYFHMTCLEVEIQSRREFEEAWYETS